MDIRSKRGSGIDSRTSSIRTSEGLIPDIQKACRLGNPEAVRAAIEANPVGINEVDSKLGWSPLYRTVICGHIEATCILIDSGADPNIKNNLGETPLHQAADNGQHEIAEILLQARADPNEITNEGDSPLHHAAFRGDVQMCLMLLNACANPNIQNVTQGKTPLHYAVDYNHHQIVELLISHKASPLTQDLSGKTCLAYATDQEIQRALVNPECAKRPSDESQPGPNDSRPTSFDREPNQQLEDLNAKIRSGVRVSTEPSRGSSSRRSSEKTHTLPTSQPDTSSEMYEWLKSIKLEELWAKLEDAGYDDSELIISQMQSNMPIDDNLLKTIGIDKIGHRMRLLAKLHEQLGHQEGVLKQDIKPSVEFPTLQEWLENYHLGDYIHGFYKAGLDDIGQIMMLQLSDYKITDNILEREVGMQKSGHRYKFLLRLDQEIARSGGKAQMTGHSGNVDNTSRTESCKKCIIM